MTDTTARSTGPITADHFNRQLAERFGFPSLRPIQERVVCRLLGIDQPAGDAMLILPTGGGKSLCYQLPALTLRAHHGDGVTLVFSPLIALMEDQVAALKARGVAAEYVNSTLSKRERTACYQALARGEYAMIYATPERMAKREFTDALAKCPGGVRLLAIDETHCISQWGHDLRPAYQQIGAYRKALGSPRTVALTATATAEVRDDIRRVLGLDDDAMPLFATGLERPNLTLRATDTWDDGDKADAIIKSATLAAKATDTQASPTSGIVYFALIKDLERFEPILRPRFEKAIPGARVEVYHGRLSPKRKKHVSRRFAEARDEPLIILATNAFGMGVDKPDIRFITHAQVPASVEAYYQEVGRAGRDGLPSLCTLCYDQTDLATQQEFIEWANPSADLLVQVMSAIEQRFAGDESHGSGHADFNSDDLRLAVVGKGHAHGRGGGVFDYALTHLAKLGCIEEAGPPVETDDRGKALTPYRFVRTLDDSEIDPAEIDAKRKRDLMRLLGVAKLAKSPDIAKDVMDYFGL